MPPLGPYDEPGIQGQQQENNTALLSSDDFDLTHRSAHACELHRVMNLSCLLLESRSTGGYRICQTRDACLEGGSGCLEAGG